MTSLRRAARLLWWCLLWLIPGWLRWRYWRGGWLGEFNRYRPPLVFASTSVTQFETRRAVASHGFLEADRLRQVPPTAIQAESLWRDPDCINHLYSFIGRRELQPLRFLRLMRWLPWIGGGVVNILEFGAGAAPFAHGVTTAWALPLPHIDVADIDWPLRDYCQQRFAGERAVTVWDVQDLNLAWARHQIGPWDAIICTETLEHVPEPLETAQLLVRYLTEGGLLLWDYCEQEKDQPLAPKGLSGRQPTIDYLTRKLEHVHGPDARGLRVSRKRQTHVRES